MRKSEEEYIKDLLEEIRNETPKKEVILTYLKNLISLIPFLGNFFSSTLSSFEHSDQVRIISRIYSLQEYLKEEIESMKVEEKRLFQRILSILEENARIYEDERFPYQVFHPDQFDIMKRLLRFLPNEPRIQSHVEREAEFLKLDRNYILEGKIGAGKTTTIVRILENIKPEIVVVVKENIKVLGVTPLYNLEQFEDCVIIWDDIQRTLEEFLKAMPIFEEFQNARIIGAIRSQNFVTLEKDITFRESSLFEKLTIEEFNIRETEELIEKLEKEFDRPLRDLKPLLVEKAMVSDGTPFYVVSIFASSEPLTEEMIISLQEDATKIWSDYFGDLSDNEKCIMKALQVLRICFTDPVERIVRDLYEKAFHGGLGGFSTSLENLEKMKWIFRMHGITTGEIFVISRDAQLFCFQISEIEMEDFNKSLYGILEPQKSHINLLIGFGLLHFMKGSNEDVMTLMCKALELNPKHAKAYTNRGAILSRMKKYDEAIKDYTTAIELDPRDPKTYINRGNAYSLTEEYDEAIKDYTTAINLNPKFAEAYATRGSAYLETKRYDEAIKDYTTAINLNPKFAEAYHERGIFHFRMKRYDEAIKDYTTAINLNPEFSKAYASRGAAYLETKRYDEAIRNLTTAIKLDPELAEAYTNRGEANLETKRYDEAINDFTAAIELNPNKSERYHNRGIAYSTIKKYDEAIKDYTTAINLNPEFAEAYNNRGAIYFKTQQYDDAIKDFTKVIELDPEFFEAYNNRGVIYFKTQQYDEAIKDFTTAIKLDPELAEAYYNRGEIYLKTQQYDDAIKDFTKVIELDPESFKAYNNRSAIYFKTQQYDEAIKDLTIAIELDPEFTEAYINRSIILSKTHKYDEAIRNMFIAAQLFLKNGSLENALTYFVKVYSMLFRSQTPEICINSGIYALAINYLNDSADYNLLNALWLYQSYIKIPEKLLLYFIRGLYGFEEDLFFLEKHLENPKNFRVVSLVIECIKEQKVTSSLRKLVSEEDSFGWNLLILCLSKLFEKSSYEVLDSVYLRKGEWDEAIDNLEKSLKICEITEDTHGKALIYDNLGIIYTGKGEWDKAMKYYEKSLKINENAGNIQGIAQTWINIGLVYSGRREWDKAMEYYEKGMKIFEDVGDVYGLAQTWENLAFVYCENGDLDIALDYCDKSFGVLEELGDKPRIAEAYRIYGIIFRKKGEFEKSREQLMESIRIYQKYSNLCGLAETFFELGLTHLEIRDKKSAEEYLEQALRIFRELNAKDKIEKSKEKLESI